MITPNRYSSRNFSIGKSAVTQGIGWRLRCRGSLSRLSRSSTRMPLSAPQSHMGVDLKLTGIERCPIG